MQWATIWVKGSGVVIDSSSGRKVNTPDLILQHFIAFFLGGTAINPSRRSWNLTDMAIQHYHSQGFSKLSKNSAMNYND